MVLPSYLDNNANVLNQNHNYSSNYNNYSSMYSVFADGHKYDIVGFFNDFRENRS